MGMGSRGANGLKSDGRIAFPLRGSRARFAVRAICEAVWFHSKLPRPSTMSISSRNVNGSGFSPRIPAMR